MLNYVVNVRLWGLIKMRYHLWQNAKFLIMESGLETCFSLITWDTPIHSLLVSLLVEL